MGRRGNVPLGKADDNRYSPDPFPPASYQFETLPCGQMWGSPQSVDFYQSFINIVFSIPMQKGKTQSISTMKAKVKGHQQPLTDEWQYKYTFRAKNEQHFFHLKAWFIIKGMDIDSVIVKPSRSSWRKRPRPFGRKHFKVITVLEL